MSEARRRLPEDLENLTPGPGLATLLASVDRDALSGRDRVRLLQARHRQAAHVQGEMYADMYAISQAEPPGAEHAVSPDEPAEPYPWAATEISFALRWTHTAASLRLDQARRMIEDLPAVAAALRNGDIDVPKALLLCDEVGFLDPELARRIIDRLIDKAAELTTGQLRAKLRRLVIAADPLAAAKRATAQVKGRRVLISQDHDNLASICGYDLLPHRVAAGYERLTAIARAAKAAGDPRKIDQLRADVLLDLLVGEGIATGAPITNGSPQAPCDTNSDAGQGRNDSNPTSVTDASTANPPSPQPVACQPDEHTPWPQAPADPDLLDPAADPPTATSHTDDTTNTQPPEPVAAEPPIEPHGDPTIDPDHEQLRPYWMLLWFVKWLVQDLLAA